MIAYSAIVGRMIYHYAVRITGLTKNVWGISKKLLKILCQKKKDRTNIFKLICPIYHPLFKMANFSQELDHKKAIISGSLFEEN